MTPDADHVLLDRCDADIRSAIADLRTKTLNNIDALCCPSLNGRERNDAESIFDDVQTALLDSIVHYRRQRVLSARDHHLRSVEAARADAAKAKWREHE